MGAVKSGTMAGFQNIAIFMGFFFDIFYVKTHLAWSDYLGSGLIVVFTIMQAIFSHLDNVRENEKRLEEVQK